MLTAAKAPLGGSTLTLALRVKRAFTAIDVLVLMVIGLKKTAGLGYTTFCFGIKVNYFAMI